MYIKKFVYKNASITCNLSNRWSIYSYNAKVDCIWCIQFKRYTAMSTVGNLDAVSLTSCNRGSIMHDTICKLFDLWN